MKNRKTIWKLVCVVGVIGLVLLFYFNKPWFRDLPTDLEQNVTSEGTDVTNASGVDKNLETPEITPIETSPSENEINHDDNVVHPETEDPKKNEVDPSPIPTFKPTPEPTLHPTDWDYMNKDYGNMAYPEEEYTDKSPYEIRINKQRNTITIYKRNKNGEYKKPVKAIICSVGRATPLGTFSLKEKYYWKSLIHKLWGQYSSRITADILFHSVPYSAPQKDKLMVNYYRQLGNTASAGCVRLTTIDAKWIVENCPRGTKVVIYNGSDPGPLGKPTAPKITTNLGWDPTDPDTRNPINLKKSKILGVKDRSIERGSSVDYLEGVFAFDKPKKATSNNIKVKTKLKSNKVGTYEVLYTFKDSSGKKLTQTATFTVQDTTPPEITGLPSVYYIRTEKDGTKESLISKLTVTDNGKTMDLDELDVKMPNSYKNGKNAVTFSISDKYGNVGTFPCKVVLDAKPPTIKLKQKNKSIIPVKQKVDKDFAKNRVTVKDNRDTITPNDLTIDIRPKKWGYQITYKAKDQAGNKSTISETVTYETFRMEVDKSKTKTVSTIRSFKELCSFVKVKSDLTNKPVDVKVQPKAKWAKRDKKYNYYTVTYQYTYQSPLGRKTLTEKTNVRVPN